MKYRTNVTIDKEAYEIFSSAGLNLSKMVNELVTTEARRIRAERWKEENRESMKAFSDFVGEKGSLSDMYRNW
ncbi:type II toxin-antitoxin system CcdA family antitoxin [Pantoea stewartii subsp. indologenes]|uniref:type II toxin-antitoxin system CcdA family antitoxin n=1 Tax=Pantoea stewartii TaxID=66269 RepID=UPI00197D6067|nr:type II toxin-antitoxin system CcdA family antitoxin [Pantoea stewartii]MDK2633925.1 type II toxin-antitoxin system CcdA family antitoxin [Pantoea stewartii subsp. indologenes]